MSKALTEQVNQLFEAVKDLQSLEEIKPHCEQFNQWINTHTSYSTASLGTVLSRAGFYKKFKALELVQGKNAESVPKHDGQGNVIGHDLKHYVLLLCGLDNSDWQERNETTRVTDRLGNGQEINPDTYLELTGKLLESNNPHELAVGLIAATGRRPHEIIARAKFTPVKGEDYQVKFTGQGKKRGETPVFQIATLYPAKYIIERLKAFRELTMTKVLLEQVPDRFPDDMAAQNRSIDSRRNGALNRVVREFFGDKNDVNPVLNFRHGEEQDNCKALRAAYLALATARDSNGSIGSKMLHAAKLAGHFTNENPNDRDLNHLVTTLGYSDYFVNQTVPFTTMPEKEKTTSLKVFQTDSEVIKELQLQLSLPNQQSAVNYLVESYLNRVDIAKQLLESQSENTRLKAQIKQLEEEKNQIEVTQPQQITLYTTELESWLETRLEALLNEKLGERANVTPPATVGVETSPPKQEIDLTGLSDAELWGSKLRGSPMEKVRRSFLAMCLYNDTVATGDNDRIAVTNLALRDLAGVNGLVVRDWIESHRDEVISHNSKYGMENRKDPSRVETYYNKGKDVSRILKLVSEQFLSGQGLASQKN